MLGIIINQLKRVLRDDLLAHPFQKVSPSNGVERDLNREILDGHFS